MPPDLALLLTLISSNYAYLEHIFMVLKVFEPVKFYYIYCFGPFGHATGIIRKLSGKRVLLESVPGDLGGVATLLRMKRLNGTSCCNLTAHEKT